MEQDKIGEFIAKLRKEKNMTQQQLADKLNVTDRAVSNWENGRRLPDYSILKELCNILEISINELFVCKKIEKENYKEIADENLLNVIEKIDKENKEYQRRMTRVLIITTLLTMLIINLLPSKNIKDVFIFIMVIIVSTISITINVIAMGEKNNDMLAIKNCKHDKR